MQKILILEDNEALFLKIRKALQESFPDDVRVFPDFRVEGAEGKHDILKDWNNLIATVNEDTEESFNKIVEYYADVNLFIIDISLAGRSNDEKGKRFWKYVKSRKPHSKFIIGTVYLFSMEIFNAEREKYVQKPQRSIKDYVIDIVREVGNLLQLTNKIFGWDEKITKEDNNISVETSAENLSDQVSNNTKQVKQKKPTFKELWKRFNFGYAFRSLLRDADGQSLRALDLFIKLGFIILSAATMFYAVYEIISAFDDPQFANKEESFELTIAEKIFLDLLPPFIVFGFFIYYKSNMSVHLTSGDADRIKEETSTRPMTLTKTLFIGSIISYLIVKTINLIFFPDTAPDLSNLPRTTLVSVGTLMLLLMIYFISIEKLNHRK